MILVFDAGNTNITAGVFKGEALLFGMRIKTDIDYTERVYISRIKQVFESNGVRPGDIKGCIIGSVVPDVTRVISSMVKKYFKIKPFLMGSGVKLNVKNMYKNKYEVGEDRLANAAAGRALFEKKDFVVVDFGTAVSFDVVNKKGEYLGGCIMPGINLSMESLYQCTARLPRVAMKYPKKIIGRTTEQSIQSGVMNGAAASINYILKGIKHELGAKKIKVVLTGGDVDRGILSHLTGGDFLTDPDFTVKGFKLIYDMNCKKNVRKN